MARLVLILGSLLVLVLSSSTPALATHREIFPSIIPLPNGFQPEGIVIGRPPFFYVGSIPTGAIFRGNLVTGEGEVLVPPQEGRAAIGLAYDRRTDYIYAAGGPTGAGFVYNAATGENVAAFQLTSEQPTFVNDVVVTLTGAYFTDSLQPQLYRVPLSLDGSLPDPSSVETIPLGGDFNFVPGEFNANGIDAPFHGKWLIIVNTFLGALYRVDPETGHADQIDLGEESVPNGDGILLKGRTLFVVQNFRNQIAVVQLDRRVESGEIVRVITDPNFRIPTTVDNFLKALYVVNARFDTQPTPDTEYEVVRVPLH